jgi:site-specific DNA-methyltransferase (adenine-specific)
LVDRQRLTKDEWSKWGSRGVWRIPSVRANDNHEAKFPLELPMRLIKLLTEANDVVLDCFMGSGTTAIAALKLARRFIGIEIHGEYVKLAREACERELLQPRLL